MSNGGDIDVESNGGGIDAESNGGDIDAESNGGDIDAESNGGDIDAESNGGDIDVEVNGALWMIGWKAKQIVISSAVFALFMLVLDFSGLAAGVVLAVGIVLSIAGLVYVWRRLSDVHDTAIEQIEQAAESLVDVEGDDIESYSLLNNAEFGMLLPPSEFYATTFVIADDRLIVHDGGTAELPRLEWRLKEHVFEYPFDRVTDMEYTPAEDFTQFGEFSVTLDDEEPDRYRFARDPDEAYQALQRRYRASSSQ